MKKGVHTLPNNGATNEWLTPPGLLAALGQFDLDPCAHPKQFYRTAKKMIAPPSDGLRSQWTGRVWINPPYGAQLKTWIDRLAQHGNGIAAGFGRSFGSVPTRFSFSAAACTFIGPMVRRLATQGTEAFWQPTGRKTPRSLKDPES